MFQWACWDLWPLRSTSSIKPPPRALCLSEWSPLWHPGNHNPRSPAAGISDDLMINWEDRAVKCFSPLIYINADFIWLSYKLIYCAISHYPSLALFYWPWLLINNSIVFYCVRCLLQIWVKEQISSGIFSPREVLFFSTPQIITQLHFILYHYCNNSLYIYA